MAGVTILGIALMIIGGFGVLCMSGTGENENMGILLTMIVIGFFLLILTVASSDSNSKICSCKECKCIEKEIIDNQN